MKTHVVGPRLMYVTEELLMSTHNIMFPSRNKNIYQGPVVQNLTKLIANVPLKFLSSSIANTLIIFAEKM